MFDSVAEKLEAAKYFVDLLKHLEEESGGILASAKPLIVRALVDAFLFEVIAAKEFFLQEINKSFLLNLPKDTVREKALLSHTELPDQVKNK